MHATQTKNHQNQINGKAIENFLQYPNLEEER